MNAVVVATTPQRTNWLNQCLRPLKNLKYPLVILSDYGYELGKIKFIQEQTQIDEFVLLHDSCIVKDLTLFDAVFNDPRSVCFSDDPVFYSMYLGKYKRSVLSAITIPTVSSKLQAVEQEILFNVAYVAADMNTRLLFTDFHNTNRFITKHKTKVMVLENKYLIKYKSCWNRSMIKP